MPALAHQRCFNHAAREAVVRCPECRQFFCRECVTEHDDRMVCTACLKKLVRMPFVKRPAFLRSLQVAKCAFGLLLAWYFFFLLGEALLKIPASFHDGTVWRVNWTDQE
jgi:hypothetical protein